MLRLLLAICFLVTSSAAVFGAQEPVGTLQQIQKTGKIRLGYRDDRPPLSFLDKEKVPVGYSIDLCRMIADEVTKTLGTDISVEYIPVTAENRFDALVNNQIDLLCGATTKTISREGRVDFTELTFVTGGSFMTLRGTKIRNNFSGKKIGVLKETTTVDELKKQLREANTEAEVVLFNSSTEALDALKASKIDAYAADQVVLIGLVIASGTPEKFTVLPELFSYEPFALALRRNDADFRLVANRVLADLYRSKNILKIYDKWIGEFSPRPSAYDAMIQLNAIPE